MKKTILSNNITAGSSSLGSVRWLRRQTIVEIIALLFVILFLYTAISKLKDYSVFREQLAVSTILKPIASFIAWGLPVTEIVVALMAFWHRWRRYGLLASFVLMILFTVYVGAILLFSKDLPCSCGGIISLLSWQQHLVLNFVLIALAGLAIKLNKEV